MSVTSEDPLQHNVIRVASKKTYDMAIDPMIGFACIGPSMKMSGSVPVDNFGLLASDGQSNGEAQIYRVTRFLISLELD